jgi:MFS family permease
VQNAAGKMTLGQGSEILMMLAMPWIFRRVSLKGILVWGLLAWTVRYALLAFGNAGAGMWMFYAAILVHGICYDFFFMTGQLYTDQEAPANLRGTAQGFYTFLTYGVGIFLGSMASGIAVDVFTRDGRREWSGVWLVSAIGSFAILMLVALFFRSKRKIGDSEQALREAA